MCLNVMRGLVVQSFLVVSISSLSMAEFVNVHSDAKENTVTSVDVSSIEIISKNTRRALIRIMPLDTSIEQEKAKLISDKEDYYVMQLYQKIIYDIDCKAPRAKTISLTTAMVDSNGNKLERENDKSDKIFSNINSDQSLVKARTFVCKRKL